MYHKRKTSKTAEILEENTRKNPSSLGLGIYSLGYKTHETYKNNWHPPILLVWRQKGTDILGKVWQFLIHSIIYWPTPVLLPGKSHGWRSLVGCSPWGHKESTMTERLLFHFSLSCIGEGNGNPLQCSCLEDPRDGGAWWAAAYGVAQSRTRLKRLSSSSIQLYISIKIQNWRGEFYCMILCTCIYIYIHTHTHTHTKNTNWKP